MTEQKQPPATEEERLEPYLGLPVEATHTYQFGSMTEPKTEVVRGVVILSSNALWKNHYMIRYFSGGAVGHTAWESVRRLSMDELTAGEVGAWCGRDAREFFRAMFREMREQEV